MSASIHRPTPATPARTLIESVPTGHVEAEQLYRDLPEILETTLELLLHEIDASLGSESSGAIGCRILAATIARLMD